MAININNLGGNTPINQNIKNQAESKAQAQQTATTQQPKPSQDSVSLTPQAQKMSELHSKSSQGPAINQKKVDELKKAIESGEYKVNPEKLAASIAKFEFDLI